MSGMYGDVRKALDVLEDAESELEHVAALAELNELVAGYLSSAVTSARDSGETWSAIGEALGMSRQGAWRRFGPV